MSPADAVAPCCVPAATTWRFCTFAGICSAWPTKPSLGVFVLIANVSVGNVAWVSLPEPAPAMHRQMHCFVCLLQTLLTTVSSWPHHSAKILLLHLPSCVDWSLLFLRPLSNVASVALMLHSFVLKLYHRATENKHVPTLTRSLPDLQGRTCWSLPRVSSAIIDVKLPIHYQILNYPQTLLHYSSGLMDGGGMPSPV